MPCNCDHLEPTLWERESRKVAKHLCWLWSKAGIKVPKDVKKAAKNYYGNADKVHLWTAMLCDQCEASENIIYSADAIRDPKARKLATWWEKHQKADKAKRNG